MQLSLIHICFAKYLQEHKDELENDVVLIFQPAEEGPGGAQLLVDAGLFEKHPVRCIIGCHIFPQVPQGKVACRKGAMMARNGEVDVHIYGESAHGAQPQLGHDAVLAAGAVITGLHTIPVSYTHLDVYKRQRYFPSQ